MNEKEVCEAVPGPPIHLTLTKEEYQKFKNAKLCEEQRKSIEENYNRIKNHIHDKTEMER